MSGLETRIKPEQKRPDGSDLETGKVLFSSLLKEGIESALIGAALLLFLLPVNTGKAGEKWPTLSGFQ